MNRKYTFLVILFLLAQFSANAQFTYTNEECSGARPIAMNLNGQLSDSVFQELTYTDNALSTIPVCDGTQKARHELWFSFIATSTSVTPVTDYINCFYQLFSGDCGSLTSISCGTTATPTATTGLIIGQRYLIRFYLETAIAINNNDNDGSFKVSLLGIPVNDECGSALTLYPQTDRANNIYANRFNSTAATASGTACVAAPAGWGTEKDLWFKFTAISVDMRLYVLSDIITKVQLYQGAVGALTSQAEWFSQAASNSFVMRNLTVGNVYHIRVGNTTTSKFSIAIREGLLPNDECVGADTIVHSTNVRNASWNTFENYGATASGGGCMLTSSKDGWYIFRATSTACVVVRNENASSGIRFGLMSGPCGSGVCLASGTGSITYSGLTVGSYYYLRVEAPSVNPDRNVSFAILPKATNDDCTSAPLLSIYPSNYLHNTVTTNHGLTTSLPAACRSSVQKDFWYRFVATDTAHLVSIDSDQADPDFEVYSGDCNNLVLIHCSNQTPDLESSPIMTSRIVGGLIPGNTYYFRGYGNAQDATYSIDINKLPANDECSGAITIPLKNTLAYSPIDNNGILQATQSLPRCNGTGVAKDIWYKFTATHTSAALVSNYGMISVSSSVLGFEVYGGNCSALSSIACITQTGNHRVFTLTNLVVGQQYYIRQYGNYKSNTVGVIDRPSNDEIAGAIQIAPTPTGITPTPFYSHGASLSFGKMCAAAPQTYHDVWFYFIVEKPSHSINVVADATTWTGMDAGAGNYRVEAFRGFAPDSATLRPKYLSCGTGSMTLNGLTIGDTIYIRVADNSAAGNSSIFTVKVDATGSIDEPTAAAQLNLVNQFQYVVTTAGATQSMPPGCTITDFPDDDIWFRFEAAANIKRIVCNDRNRDITLQLFSGTPGSLIPIQCASHLMVLPTNLVNGTTYYVRAYSRQNAQVATFRIGLFDEEDIMAGSCESLSCLGANLIENPTLERTDAYIAPPTPINITPGRMMTKGWWSSGGTPDVYDADTPYGEPLGTLLVPGNYQTNVVPHSGKTMLGVFYENSGSWSEYVTTRLKQPLIKGKTYMVSFWMLTPMSRSAVFNAGIRFSNDSILQMNSTVASELPHVSNEQNIIDGPRGVWTKVCGRFTADKDYIYATIGNFGARTIYLPSLAYFLFDDVVVSEVQCSTTPLPLNLSQFTGRLNQAKQTELDWTTSSESNTSHFDIEWSTDGIRYEKIGTVTAAGNSNTTQHYQYLHMNPATGNNYYRLRMVDRDNSYTMSNVVKVRLELTTNISIFPNPVESKLYIRSTDPSNLSSVSIYDVHGRRIYYARLNNSTEIDMSHYASGMYMVEVMMKDGQKMVAKIIRR